MFEPEDIDRYEALICEAKLMALEKRGLLELDKLYSKYSDLLDELFDDKFKAVGFVTAVEKECGDGVKVNLRWHGLEPLGEFKLGNLNKLRPYRVKILSSKRVFEKDQFSNINEKCVGFMDLNGERFRYEAPWELPLDELTVWAIPWPHEKKDGLVDIRFKILGYEEVYADYGLASVQVVEDAFRDLKSIRDYYVKIVGEDVNVALSVLALASRLNKIRDFWIMGVVVQGQSSSGKSYLMSNILKPWSLLGKVEEFTRFTGPYLERKFSNLDRNLDDVIFAIYELFSNTPQQLHLTLSEGKLRVGLIDKETGDPIEFNFEGMPFLFSTTPMEGIRTDLKNRIVNISMDESDEQTRRITDFETKLGEDPEFAETIQRLDEVNMRRLAKFINGLEKKYVLVPYAQELKNALTFYDVKLRRDWKKLISLLHASALLFQEHRPKITLSSGEEAVVATEEDFENLLYIMPAFEETLINLPKRHQKLLKIMIEEGQDEYTVRDLVILANKRGWRIGDRWVRDILSELAAEGIVAKDESGRAHKYQVVKQPGKIEFGKVKLPVLRRLAEFYRARGMESEYLELTRKYPEIRENPASEGRSRGIGEEPEVEVNTQRMETNTMDKGLGEGSESPVPLPVDGENPVSGARNPGKPGNSGTSGSLPNIPDSGLSGFIKAPGGSPHAGARGGEEVDA